MVKLLLVRHGETVENKAQIMQGQTDGQLCDEGIEQARALRDALSHERIDVFVASDLRRAVHTCEIVAEPHGKDVVTTPLLRERDWGGFTGRYIPDLRDAEWPPDIESLECMRGRARDFMSWLKKTYPGRTVLAVGHGIINKAIQSVYFDKPMGEIRKMGNAEVRVLML